MLLGEYEHTIDDKNRLTLPAKFRRAFEDGIVVTRGLDGCLYAWTPRAWENYRDTTLSALHPLSQEGRRMHRHFYSGASETTRPPTHADDLRRAVEENEERPAGVAGTNNGRARRKAANAG